MLLINKNIWNPFVHVLNKMDHFLISRIRMKLIFVLFMLGLQFAMHLKTFQELIKKKWKNTFIHVLIMMEVMD